VVVVIDCVCTKGARTVQPLKPATQCPAVSTTLGAITDPEHAATIWPFLDIWISADSGYALAVDPPMIGTPSASSSPSSRATWFMQPSSNRDNRTTPPRMNLMGTRSFCRYASRERY
jgi:hypothetical protein